MHAAHSHDMSSLQKVFAFDVSVNKELIKPKSYGRIRERYVGQGRELRCPGKQVFFLLAGRTKM